MKTAEHRFCKKHGYISCHCPEEMGLSLSEFQELQRKLESVIYDLTLEQEKRKKLEQLVDSYENSLSNLGYQDMKAKLRKAEEELAEYRFSSDPNKAAFTIADYHAFQEKLRKAEAVVAAAKKAMKVKGPAEVGPWSDSEWFDLDKAITSYEGKEGE